MNIKGYSYFMIISPFVDNWSKTPLHYAAQRGSNISGLYLLTKGAEVNAVDDDGNTPMSLAMLCNHPSKIWFDECF